jgi:hypothetical protein
MNVYTLLSSSARDTILKPSSTIVEAMYGRLNGIQSASLSATDH